MSQSYKEHRLVRVTGGYVLQARGRASCLVEIGYLSVFTLGGSLVVDWVPTAIGGDDGYRDVDVVCHPDGEVEIRPIRVKPGPGVPRCVGEGPTVPEKGSTSPSADGGFAPPGPGPTTGGTIAPEPDTPWPYCGTKEDP